MSKLYYTLAPVTLFAFVFINASAQYSVPTALVEPLSPRGFRVSIPDDPDYHINIFAFHGNINKEFNGREAGTFSRDITKAKDGRWTFIDTATKLKPGDVIHYWTYVELIEDDGRKIGFPRDDQMFTVAELQPGDNKLVTTSTIQPSDAISFPQEEECTPGLTMVNSKFSCTNQLIFETTFKGNAAKSFKNWQKENRFADDPDFEFVMYSDDSRNIFVKDHLLHIKPTLTNNRYGPGFVHSKQIFDLGEKCTGTEISHCKKIPQAYIILPPVISARINTKNTFSFKYGYVEIRAKLPKGDWIYPELYLNSKDEKYGKGYESGQIRIAFLPGNNGRNKKLTGGCILGESEGGRTFAIRGIQKEGGSWADDFHVFSMIWKPNGITMFVDDQEYGKIEHITGGFATKAEELDLQGARNWNSGTEFAPFDQEMYLSIGVGVGGHSFPDEAAKPWTNKEPKAQLTFNQAKSDWHPTWNKDSQLIVDYIRVKSL